MGEEVVDEADIHSLHDKSYGQEARVDGGRPVTPEKLHSRQLVLFLGSVGGILDELVLRQVSVGSDRGWSCRLQLGGVLRCGHGE